MTLPVIVTRAEPGNAATVARARNLGLDVRAVPLFAAHALGWQAPDPGDFDALLLTSAQALRLSGPELERLAALPAYAVGSATAAAAEAAGLTVAMTGSGDAQSLVDAMASSGKTPRILWLCGRERTAFDARGVALVPLPVYAVDPVDPPSDWEALTAAPAILLTHSARGAARIAELVGPDRGHLSLVAISGAAAAAAGEGWATVTVTERPDDAAMVTAAHHLCQKVQK
ncbi:uroporphyrinogen-III synthase [Sphingopyxis sp. QXT-31]|uniref:uroporphyrinogen-III synthase n=1 Tax=Sphingopyxis sp. QXT-31 TaxID=1357916 RepID=UPI00097907DC|nr:uroporphyrinogen-III synthase [Sphingopyxis sp. QXT-31]APZ99779.1 uroporphyrinogen-III synthase [Sphingopyxis sp. QXT-31]